MDDKNPTGFILLTYKNKALLMYKNKSSIDKEKHEWTLIKAVKQEKETLKQTLAKAVYRETGIKLKKIELLNDNFYHASLTDSDVNNIKRDELQLLNFFTPDEFKDLTLNPITKDFITEYDYLI